jgi:hypothetical protein
VLQHLGHHGRLLLTHLGHHLGHHAAQMPHLSLHEVVLARLLALLEGGNGISHARPCRGGCALLLTRVRAVAKLNDSTTVPGASRVGRACGPTSTSSISNGPLGPPVVPPVLLHPAFVIFPPPQLMYRGQV